MQRGKTLAVLGRKCASHPSAGMGRGPPDPGLLAAWTEPGETTALETLGSQ